MLKNKTKNNHKGFNAKFAFTSEREGKTDNTHKWQLPKNVCINNRLNRIVNLINSSDSLKQIKGKSELQDYISEVHRYLHYNHQGVMRTDSGKSKRKKYNISSDLISMALTMAYRKTIGVDGYITNPKDYLPTNDHGTMVWNNTLHQVTNADAFDIIDLLIGKDEQEKYWKNNVGTKATDPAEKESPQDDVPTADVQNPEEAVDKNFKKEEKKPKESTPTVKKNVQESKTKEPVAKSVPKQENPVSKKKEEPKAEEKQVQKEKQQPKEEPKVESFKAGSPLIKDDEPITFSKAMASAISFEDKDNKADDERVRVNHEEAEKQFPRLKELREMLENVKDNKGEIHVYYQEVLDVCIGANVGKVIRVSVFDRDYAYMRDILVDPNTMYNGFSVATADRNIFGMEDFVPLDEANTKKIVRLARGFFNTRDRKELMQNHTIPTNTFDVYRLVRMDNIRSLLPINQDDWSKFINNLHSLCSILKADVNSCVTVLEYVSPVNFKIGVVKTQDIKEMSTITFNPEKYKKSEYKIERYVQATETETK